MWEVGCMIEIIQTMNDMEKEEWDSLAGIDKVETSYDWFCFAEDLELKSCPKYCHAVYRDKRGNILGILPAYYHNIHLRNFVNQLGLIPIAKYFPEMITSFKTTRVHIPLSCDSRYFGDRKYFNECLAELKNLSREKKHFLFTILDSNEKMNLPDLLCVETFPETYTEPYPSWNAYTESQKGKRGKHIRYEYKKSVESGTKTYLKEDLDGYHDLLYNMYMDVSAKYRHPVVFPKDFFKRMEDALPGYTKCLFAENKGEIIGYLFLLENDYFISCKYAGRNYQAPDPYSYFRLMYELIKYSIKKKKPVSIEKTSYEAKLRRGFKLIEKKCYIKPNLPIVGDIYTMLAKMANKKISNHIKEIKTHV
jgi:predicted N-acyltransferase